MKDTEELRGAERESWVRREDDVDRVKEAHGGFDGGVSQSSCIRIS